VPKRAEPGKRARPGKIGAAAYGSYMKNLPGTGPATRALDALKPLKSEIGIFS